VLNYAWKVRGEIVPRLEPGTSKIRVRIPAIITLSPSSLISNSCK